MTLLLRKLSCASTVTLLHHDDEILSPNLCRRTACADAGGALERDALEHAVVAAERQGGGGELTEEIHPPRGTAHIAARASPLAVQLHTGSVERQRLTDDLVRRGERGRAQDG